MNQTAMASGNGVRPTQALATPSVAVTVSAVRHYLRPAGGRTLCGQAGTTPSAGDATCGRCRQILAGVDTSWGRHLVDRGPEHRGRRAATSS